VWRITLRLSRGEAVGSNPLLGLAFLCLFLIAFGPRLQRPVHLFKPTHSVAIQAAAEQTDQQPAKPLALLKPHLTFAQRLDQKTMLAIEDARKQKTAQPPQLAAGICCEDDGREAHDLSAAGLDSDLKPRPLLRCAGNRLDKGIPLRIGGKIRKNGPRSE